ncbi:MAG TPA: Mth938-like domain-containing protein [Steroidobacter sp.]|nr:Mth938-like domain-containing protein [Steroidobacter sp.]
MTDDRTAGALLVRSYSPGELRIGEEVLRRSCVLRADQLVSDWRPQVIEELTLADFDAVLALEPEIVVLGTGERQQFPPTELMATMLSRGIGLEIMATDAACRTYNVLVSEDRRVVAALML